MQDKENNYDTVIVGGGPAGLFCAANISGDDKRVLVLEKKDSCGRKLLITGSGQCNLTHAGEIGGFISHYGSNGKFLRPALMGFTNNDLVGFFEEHGLSFETDKNGKIFPSTKKAGDILSVLLRESRDRGVDVHCGEPVFSVSGNDGSFIIRTGSAQYIAKNLVISAGGASYPQTGSTGDGFKFAEDLGIEVTEIAPALTPVYVHDYLFGDLSGISFEDVRISLFRGNKKVSDNTGDLLFTHKGLSGPGILDFSRNVVSGDLLKVSFINSMGPEEFRNDFSKRVEDGGIKLVKTILSGYGLPERFVKKIIEISGIEPDLTCAHLPKKERNLLVKNLTEYPFEVMNLGGFNEAMVTRGGVSLDGINKKTMESKRVPGLFFIGEVLDIDGDTGGYNLQAAFSTAFLAAKNLMGT